MDLFHSFSLRGNLTLTTAELEMALSLVDGLEVTRREVRNKSPMTQVKRSCCFINTRSFVRSGGKHMPFCVFHGYVAAPSYALRFRIKQAYATQVRSFEDMRPLRC